MNKEEFIKRRGEGAYGKMLQQSNAWREANPDKAKANDQESSCKGGKRYEHMLKHKRTGLSGERARIRVKHANHYRPFKQIIAPNSQIHHEWIPDTADFRGVALVEKDQHRHGIIDVIQILDGEITLLSEKEILEQGSVI